MTIRIADAADTGTITGLAIAFRDHLQREVPTDDAFLRSIAHLMNSGDAEFYLCEREGKAVGYVLQRFRHSMWASGTEATIEDLFVHPDARRSGLGREPIAFAVRRARENGSAAMCLDTNENNIASQRIYKRLGFGSFSQRWRGNQIFFYSSGSVSPEPHTGSPMPLPFEYQNASMQFDQFMVDARDHSGLATTNMAWNMVVGVLLTFRRRLTIGEALRFADILPPVVRAIFVENWDPDEPIRDFGSPEALLAEVRSLRAEHNFSPDNAIQAVAAALRRQVDHEKFERVMRSLSAGAQHYWSASQDSKPRPTPAP